MYKKIDVGIVLQDPFPIGMGSTNRVLSYAKELAKHFNVKVYIPIPTDEENNLKNKMAIGQFKRVNFEYLGKTTIWNYDSHYLRKIWILIKGLCRLFYILKREKPNIIIFYSAYNKIWMGGVIFFSKYFLKSKIIIEENEYPKILDKNFPKLLEKVLLSVYKHSNGMLVMTNELEIYYKSLNVKRIFVLPMTVDIERFGTKQNVSIQGEDYFAYCGSNVGYQRDGLLDSIIAFNSFQMKYNKFKFYIIGPIVETDNLYIKMKDYISKNNLENNVLFLGIKPSYEIPEYLINSTGLIMTPPKDFVSGGFPTKLGEYLASGKPVITSNLSDISKYLDKKNAFLIEPGNTKDICSKMLSIVEEPDLAQSVGKNGRLIASALFGAQRYMTKLELFLFEDCH